MILIEPFSQRPVSKTYPKLFVKYTRNNKHTQNVSQVVSNYFVILNFCNRHDWDYNNNKRVARFTVIVSLITVSVSEETRRKGKFRSLFKCCIECECRNRMVAD
jgi:hypothetical protein